MNPHSKPDRKSERGVVAYMFTGAALLFMAVGLHTAQLGLISGERASLQSAADAAALAAVAAETGDDEMEAVARRTFMANLKPEQARNLKGLEIDTDASQERTSIVRFRAEFHPIAPNVLSPNAVQINGEARARGRIRRFVDIDLWLDASASMGVAADEAGRDRLRALSANDREHRNCAFACHMPTRLTVADNQIWATSMQRAHANGIKLRIDVMKDSLEILLSELAEARTEHAVVPRLSAAALANNWNRQLNLTGDLEAVRNYVRGFSLSSSAASRLSRTMATGRDAIPVTAQQRRGTADDPQRFVILVTDGMQFDWGNISPGPISAEVCAQIRQRVNRLIVVHIPYVRLDGDNAFNHWVRPVYDQLGPALQACASPNSYLKADKPDDLHTAFRQIARMVTATPALTQ